MNIPYYEMSNGISLLSSNRISILIKTIDSKIIWNAEHTNVLQLKRTKCISNTIRGDLLSELQANLNLTLNGYD